MSITPISSFKGALAVPQSNEDIQPKPAPFVRSDKTKTSIIGGHAIDQAIAPQTSGPMTKWKSKVLRACHELGLKPGEQTTLMIRINENGKNVDVQPMILRRTAANDAFVLQTPEEAISQPFNGLCLKDNTDMSYDMHPIPINAGESTHSKLGYTALNRLGQAFSLTQDQ